MGLTLAACYLTAGTVFAGGLHVWLIRTLGEGRGLHWFPAAVIAMFWPFVFVWLLWRFRTILWEVRRAGRGGSPDATRDDSPLPRWPLPRSESPVEWN